MHSIPFYSKYSYRAHNEQTFVPILNNIIQFHVCFPLYLDFASGLFNLHLLKPRMHLFSPPHAPLE